MQEINYNHMTLEQQIEIDRLFSKGVTADTLEGLDYDWEELKEVLDLEFEEVKEALKFKAR
jgi:hypothetical protein